MAIVAVMTAAGFVCVCECVVVCLVIVATDTTAAVFAFLVCQRR